MRALLLSLVLTIPLHLHAAPVDVKDLRPSEQAYAAQILLKRGGYLNGPVDGVFGKGSRAALDQFREDNSMYGQIGEELNLFDLRSLQGKHGKVDSGDLPAQRGCDFARGARVQYHNVNRWEQETIEYGDALAAKDGKILVKTDSYFSFKKNKVFTQRPKKHWIACGRLELK